MDFISPLKGCSKEKIILIIKTAAKSGGYVCMWPGCGCSRAEVGVLLAKSGPAWHEALTRTGCVGRRKMYPVPSLRGVVTPNLGVCFLPVDGIRATRPLFSGR